MNRFLLNKVVKGVMLCLPFVAGVAEAAVTATVNVYPEEKAQTVGGIGGGIVYYQDWLTNHPYREAVLDTLFNGLGISCLRMGNWAIEDNESDNLCVANDAIIYKAAKQYCGNDLKVVMASWTPPASLKSNNDRNGSDGQGQSSLKKNWGQFVYDDYAKWWAESLTRYHNVGVYPDFISIQNEPDCDPKYAGMKLGTSESYNVASYGKALSAVYSQVSKLPNAPKFIGVDNLGIGWNQCQDYVNSLDRSLLSGYSFHYYHSGVNGADRYSHPNDFIEAMRGLASDFGDKPMFMTENSQLRERTILDGMYTAWIIANAFNINKVSYYTHWNLIWGTENDGCITLQKWDEDYSNPYEKGFKVNTEYHGLRHFSKFVRPGMKVINTWATNNQMTTCGFMMPDSSAFTVVIINQGGSELNVDQDLNLDPEAYNSQVVITVPEKEIWSKCLGAYNGPVTMPSHSIVTISYTKINHVNVSPYIFTFNENVHDNSWDNAANWEPSYKPWPTDTVIIRKGDCLVEAMTHEAPINVQLDASLILTGDFTVKSAITLNGGSCVKVTEANGNHTLSCDSIIIYQPTNFVVGGEMSTLTIDAPIVSSATVQKVGPGSLRMKSSNPHLTGWFKLRGGKLIVESDNPFGTSEVEVMGGSSLVIDTMCTISRLMIQSDSTLCLNNNLVVTNISLGGIWLPNGIYTKDDYPLYITGDSALYVNHPYPVIVKHGGDSIQTVNQDSAIADFQYTWEYADNVEVDWNPHQPEGLSVDVITSEKTVYFTGTPSESGEFAFTVSSVSIEDSVFVQSGLLSVIPLSDTTSQMSTDRVASDYVVVSVSPNPVLASGNAVVAFNTTQKDNVVVTVQNVSGQILAHVESVVNSGPNSIQLPKVPCGVYLVTIKHSFGMSKLKLIVK